MERCKDVFDMSGCRNLCDFVQKNFKCSEREAHILISKINFFKRVEDGAEMLSFVLENLKDKDLRWKKINFDKVDLDFLAFLDELKTEAILDGYEWTTDRLYDSVIDALETAYDSYLLSKEEF